MSPLVEIPPDGRLGCKIMWQISPLAPRLEDVKEGIENVSQGSRSGPSARINGNQRFDAVELSIGQATGIWFSFPILLYAGIPLMGQSLR